MNSGRGGLLRRCRSALLRVQHRPWASWCILLACLAAVTLIFASTMSSRQHASELVASTGRSTASLLPYKRTAMPVGASNEASKAKRGPGPQKDQQPDPGAPWKAERQRIIDKQLARDERYFSIEGWRHSMTPDAGALERVAGGDLRGGMAWFVRREGHRLVVNGRQFVVNGMNRFDLLALAADPATRPRVSEVLAGAAVLGMNTVRLWAFNDGLGTSWPLQPVDGWLDNVTLGALDWVVEEARRHELRVLLVLTSGRSRAQGGMWQYVRWVDPGATVTAFYSSNTVKAKFLDAITALLVRTNPLTGRQYRHEPALLGWELADSAGDPGHVASSHLHAWTNQIATHIRQYDPNHLIASGSAGFFGPTSPHLLQYNPPAQLYRPPLPSPLQYDAQCEGQDFMRDHDLAALDLASLHVYPDEWLPPGPEGGEGERAWLAWAQRWVAAHAQDALRMQKPLLITEVGAQRPLSRRNALLRQVYDQVARYVAGGTVPVAGTILWGLAPDTTEDWDGYTVHGTAAAARAGRPLPLPPTPQDLAEQAEWQRFTNWGAMVGCQAGRAMGLEGGAGEQEEGAGEVAVREPAAQWSAGWEQALQIVANHSRYLAHTPAGPLAEGMLLGVAEGSAAGGQAAGPQEQRQELQTELAGGDEPDAQPAEQEQQQHSR